MYRLSDNYYHRKCYFARQQVPTQTVMKDRMGEPLAQVYFKSMRYKLKVLAGLEPPLLGAGSEWYQPPEEQLAGRAVLKPIDASILKLLGFDGLNLHGEKCKLAHYAAMKEETRKALEESDANWKEQVTVNNREHYGLCGEIEAAANSRKLCNGVVQFEAMYRTSLEKTEAMIMDAAVKEIKRIQQETYDLMNKRYKEFLNTQATRIYNEYEVKLNDEKARLKAEFMNNIEELRNTTATKIHDINYEKHLAIEKLRHFLQCQKLSCDIYVSLIEREEAQAQMTEDKYIHKKKIKKLQHEIQVKDFEIDLETEQQQKRKEVNLIWKKKSRHVVKKFQMFVEYCLKLLPEHAEFFLNMEKLMLLQIEKATENPTAVSIVESESGIHTPVPRPHPFYLVCDKGFKPKVNQKLCPEHCTSSASQLPVIVVNKKFIYSACDNLEMFTDKVSKYIYGARGDDADVEDHHIYEWDVPVKYTSSTKLHELKLESSLMQLLQQELPNIRNLPLECCNIPYCFCSPLNMSKLVSPVDSSKIYIPHARPKPIIEEIKLTKKSILELQREPKWESYLEYVKPRQCKCAKMAKKHLAEHLPPYMRNMSRYGPPELPNYETCPVEGLKRIVKKAMGISTPPPPPEKVPSKTRDASTQYVDFEHEYLCTCFSDDELSKFLATLRALPMFDSKVAPIRCDVVNAAVEGSYLDKSTATFVTERAFSLRHLLDKDSELEEIFKKENCQNYDN